LQRTAGPYIWIKSRSGGIRVELFRVIAIRTSRARGLGIFNRLFFSIRLEQGKRFLAA
jgi:hypothetical protein